MANYSYNPEESLSREAFGTPVILQNTESHHIALTNVRCLILQFDQNKQIKPLMAINVGCQLSIINAYSCNHDLILPVFLCPFFFCFPSIYSTLSNIKTATFEEKTYLLYLTWPKKPNCPDLRHTVIWCT